MNKTKVHFRKMPYPDYMQSMKGKNEIIALFPDDTYNVYSTYKTIYSYMHVGQHSEASYSLITELESATLEEYKSLADELQSIGYNLEILK